MILTHAGISHSPAVGIAVTATSSCRSAGLMEPRELDVSAVPALVVESAVKVHAGALTGFRH